MDPFSINILGCGSALPTGKHGLSGQVLNIRNKLFMVDCGEGSQLQMRRMHLKFNRLSHIFISHLHGDHCFGLPGLISTLGMLGRNGELTLHAHAETETLLRPLLNFFCKDLPYKVRIEAISPSLHEKIYEDRSIEVFSIPLHHRIPTTGFLFREKQRDANIIKEMIYFYQIPIKELPAIKKGADFITSSGEVIPNNRLVKPALPRRSYAYCSDTAYSEKIIPIIEGVDLLYHEATFLHKDLPRAEITFHSTALQAAKIAQMAAAKQLVIGHFSARYSNYKELQKEAQSIFPNTLLANDGMIINL